MARTTSLPPAQPAAKSAAASAKPQPKTNKMSPAKARRIPKFKTRQEEAEWWDTHDISDYWDELTPAPNPFYKQAIGHSIVVPLDSDAITALVERAKEQGIPFTSLAGQWIEERLRAG